MRSLRRSAPMLRTPFTVHGWAFLAATLAFLAATSFAARAQEEKPILSVAPGPWADKSSEFGAVAFTSDGSYTTTWKRASREEAESKVRAECYAFNRGKCEVLSFGAGVCAALASGQIGQDRRATYSGGGATREVAEKIALSRCSARSSGKCEVRTTLCGDGR